MKNNEDMPRVDPPPRMWPEDINWVHDKRAEERLDDGALDKLRPLVINGRVDTLLKMIKDREWSSGLWKRIYTGLVWFGLILGAATGFKVLLDWGVHK
jgi:hypothetical protein